MRRATVTIPDDLEASLEAYNRQHDVSRAMTAVLQAALREYLARRGFRAAPKTLRITPATKGSGARDISIRRDSHLGEG